MSSRTLTLTLTVLAAGAIAASHASAQEQAFVGAYGTGAIDVVDLATNTVVNTFVTAGNAEGLACSPDGSRVYFSGAGHVMAFDADTGGVLADLNLATSLGMPLAHPNGQVVYVGFGTQHAVGVFDTSTYTFGEMIDLPSNTVYMSLSSDAATLYAASISFPMWKTYLSLIDTASNGVVASLTFPYPTMENAVSPDGSVLLASAEFDNWLVFVDLSTNTVSGTLAMPGGPRQIRFSPDGSTAYVANAYVGKVVVVDIASQAVSGEWNLGGSLYGLSLSEDGQTAYVVDYASDLLKVVDVATGVVTASVLVSDKPTRVEMRPVPCFADFNGDGTVNTMDVLAFLNAWSAGDPSADFNGDGAVNTLDVLAFLNAWSVGC